MFEESLLERAKIGVFQRAPWFASESFGVVGGQHTLLRVLRPITTLAQLRLSFAHERPSQICIVRDRGAHRSVCPQFAEGTAPSSERRAVKSSLNKK